MKLVRIDDLDQDLYDIAIDRTKELSLRYEAARNLQIKAKHQKEQERYILTLLKYPGYTAAEIAGMVHLPVIEVVRIIKKLNDKTQCKKAIYGA